MKNGETVGRFEAEFASYVGARYGIALNSGTSTLHTALVAMGLEAGDEVAVPPLTMSATTIAVLQAGMRPVFRDVDPQTWVMETTDNNPHYAEIHVSLYGLCHSNMDRLCIDDAAQTLRQHSGAAFTSYSFQASKILPLGEGGMLVTDSEGLATKAREFSSLGYRMKADQPRIDPAVLKHPTYERHHTLGWNYRMNDLTAYAGLEALTYRWTMSADVYGEKFVDRLRRHRQEAANMYRQAIAGCSWTTPQYVPEGWTHDYWAYAIALESPDLWEPFTQAIVRHGGEMPYGAWRLTYREPAFRHLAEDGCCPVAEDLQPRLVHGQTNRLDSARRNADAWAKAIREMNG